MKKLGAAALLVLVVCARSMDAQPTIVQLPRNCPASLNFNQMVEMTYPNTPPANPVDVTFYFGTGTRPANHAPSPYTAYKFGSIISQEGNVQLLNPYGTAECSRIGIVSAPGDTLWEDTAEPQAEGGSGMIWLYRVTEDECEDDTYRGSGRTRQPVESHKRVVGSAPTQANAECYPGGNGGGNGGGGGGEAEFCLFLDYYDDDGYYLYSVLVTCWIAQM